MKRTTFFFRIAACFLFAFSSPLVNSQQIEIASQSFDNGTSGFTDNLGYNVSAPGLIEVMAGEGMDYAGNPTNALRFTGDDIGDGQNFTANFDNVSFPGFANVTVTVAFKSFEIDGGENLWLDISYDDGNTWTENIMLVEGHHSGADDIDWGDTDEDNYTYAGGSQPVGTTGSPYPGGTNPFTFNLPGGTNQVKVRLRTTNLDNHDNWIYENGWNAPDEDYYYIDNLIIEGEAPNMPKMVINGNGQDIDNGDITPDLSDFTDFGQVNTWNTSTYTYTITNIGNEILNISNVGLQNNSPEFTVTQPPITVLDTDESTTFTVSFSSDFEGTFNDAIVVESNDPTATAPNHYYFNVRGEAKTLFYDSDGDGITDNLDIDADNDGIPDGFEQEQCKLSDVAVTTNYKFLEETFGAGINPVTTGPYNGSHNYGYPINVENGYAETDYEWAPYYFPIDGQFGPGEAGWSVNDGEYTVYHNAWQLADWAGPGNDSHWYQGEDHTPGDTDGRMAVFNADYDPGIFYTAHITGVLPNVPISYSFWVLNLMRPDSDIVPSVGYRIPPDIRVEFRDVNNNILLDQGGAPIIIETGEIPRDVTWHNYAADIYVPVDEFVVYFINNAPGGNGNDLALDDIFITQTLCDSDADDIADIFDLDSDNDGIPDVIEVDLAAESNGQAFLDHNAPGWIDANNNGMHDAAEAHWQANGGWTAAGGGTINLPDTDGDGVPNMFDLDSDNDGIFDVDESGAGNVNDPYYGDFFAYNNGDGDIDGNGVGDGPDTDAFRLTDVDSDGITETFSDGILDIFDYWEGDPVNDDVTFANAYGNAGQGMAFGTDYVQDTDGDGIPDYIDPYNDTAGESAFYSTIQYQLNPGNYTLNPDGSIDDGDSDGDGVVDVLETYDVANGVSFGCPRDLDNKLQLYFDGRNDYLEDTSGSGRFMNDWSEATLMGWIKLDDDFQGDAVLFGQANFEVGIRNEGGNFVIYTHTRDLDTSIMSGVSSLINHLETYDPQSNNEFAHISNNSEDIMELFGIESIHELEAFGIDTMLSFLDDLETYGGIAGDIREELVSTAGGLTTLQPGQWYHIAGSYHANETSPFSGNPANRIQLYVNGALITEGFNETNAGAPLVGMPHNFSIGRAAHFFPLSWDPSMIDEYTYFKGYMDEARVFSKSLSEDEVHKVVYQEIYDNGGTAAGTVIPLDITDFDYETETGIPLPWVEIKRNYRMDIYQNDETEDISLDATGIQLFNIKDIEVQSAPMPFITQLADENVPNAVDIPADGVRGMDAIDYDWSIVHVKHDGVWYNDRQKHLGLLVDTTDEDSGSPIEFEQLSNSELNVSWYLNLDGFIDLVGESQLVQGAQSQLDVASGGHIEIDQQGYRDLYTYNYWASPTSAWPNVSANNADYTIQDVLRDGTDPNNPAAINFINGYNGNPGPPISIAKNWLWKYSNLSGDYADWQHVGYQNPLQVGEGYTMKGVESVGNLTATQNYVFIGKPHNGTVELIINPNNEYLVGNPYPSALDANAFIMENIAINGTDGTGDNDGTNSVNVINGALYFWDHFSSFTHVLSDYEGGYATYTLMGGAPAISNDELINATGHAGTKIPERFIPVGQGFYIEAKLDDELDPATDPNIPTVNGGTLRFKNKQRVFRREAITGDGSGSVFFKTFGEQDIPEDMGSGHEYEEYTDNREKIRLTYDSPSGFHRQLLVGVDSLATDGFDIGFDAPLGENNANDMAWLLNTKFSIQAVNNFDEDQVLPLSVKTEEGGIATIRIAALENVHPKRKIYLHDKELQVYHKLKNQDYEVYLEAGEYNDRFEITFIKKKGKIKKEENATTALQTYYANATENIVVQNVEGVNVNSVEVMTMLGQKLFAQELNSDDRHLKVNVPGLSTGTYIINLHTEHGKVAKKVLVK